MSFLSGQTKVSVFKHTFSCSLNFSTIFYDFKAVGYVISALGNVKIFSKERHVKMIHLYWETGY